MQRRIQLLIDARGRVIKYLEIGFIKKLDILMEHSDKKGLQNRE
jgi:hypothetical protein